MKCHESTSYVFLAVHDKVHDTYKGEGDKY